MKNRIYTLTALLSFMAAISFGQTVPQSFTFTASIAENGIPVYYAGYEARIRITTNPGGVVLYEETNSYAGCGTCGNHVSFNVGRGVVVSGNFATAMQNTARKDLRVEIHPISLTSGLPFALIIRTLESVPTALVSERAVVADSIRFISSTSSAVTLTPTASFYVPSGQITVGSSVWTSAGNVVRLDNSSAFAVQSGRVTIGQSGLTWTAGRVTVDSGATLVTTGGITVSNSSATTDGTLRFNSGNLELRSGGTWQTVSTGGGGSSPWTTNGANISNSNTGNVGIGAPTPVAKLEVSGPIKIGDFSQGNYPQAAGMMRFQSGIFEGYNGSTWVPFGGGSAPTLSVNGNQLSISGGNTVTLPSLTPWTTVGNDIYNNNSGKVMIATVNSTRPEKFQFIDNTTGTYQNSAKFIRSSPYGTVLAVIDSGLSGDPNYNKGLSAQSIYGIALYGESTRAYGLKVRGGGPTYPASLIEANSGAAGLVVSNSSTTTTPQLNIEETNGGNYARIKLTNFSNPTNSWTVAGLNTATTANDRLNFNHNIAGDVLSITGDGKTLIKGATAFNNNFGTAGQVLQSNGNAAAPTWVTPVTAPSIYNNMVKTFIPQSNTAYAVMGSNVTVPVPAVPIPELNANVSLQFAGKGLIDIQLPVSISPLILFGSNSGDIELQVKIDGVTNQTKIFNLKADATNTVYETIDWHTLIDIPSGNHTISVAARKYTIDDYAISLYAGGAQYSYMTAVVVQQ